MVQNSSDDGISIDILSKPRFPVTFEGTVNITYIGYHVLVTSLQDDDDIIANFTAWPVRTQYGTLKNALYSGSAKYRLIVKMEAVLVGFQRLVQKILRTL